jgi:hypothetical protein
VLTKSGLPGWFPEDFKTDPALLAAFEDDAEWHATGRKQDGHAHARTWDELAAVIELSARTAALEVTPAPYGKPGGKGLYDVKGLSHTPYFEQVVKALRGRGMDKGKASAVAYGALRKWAAGGGKVHPEVRAAATAALAGEKAIGASAKAVHGHANRPRRVIDLDWAAWDAGHGEASVKAHDTASATASRDAKAKMAADHLHAAADQADRKFPSASAGSDIHAAADSFSAGDAQGAHQHLADARSKLRGASEAKGKVPGRDPVANDFSGLDSTLKQGQGQAQMMAQQQDDDAKAAAKMAKKAARAQNHAVTWADVARVVELAANPAQPRVASGSTGAGQFTSGASTAPAAAPPPAGGKSVASQTASATAKATIAKKAQQKAALMKTAAQARAKADALEAQMHTLKQELASASGATSSGQSGSTTSAGSSTTSSGASTTASTAPATASTAAATPAASTTAAAPAASTSTPALTTAQTAQITAQIGQLTTQIQAYQKVIQQATAQAAKL